jgi:hypothetical protein
MKVLSQVAKNAKWLREQLKSKFPETKFKIVSSRYSMGESIDIEWTDGPSNYEVKKLSNQFHDGKTSFVGIERRYSVEKYTEALKYITDNWGVRIPEVLLSNGNPYISDRDKVVIFGQELSQAVKAELRITSF